jgi:CTP synthase (UTP-ammonia lyase)
LRVAVVGDWTEASEPHTAIGPALAHAGAHLGVRVGPPEWIGTEEIERRGAGAAIGDVDGVWGAPGSPFRSFVGALEGIRFARERRLPFLGTCAGFQHALLEIARHVGGLPAARHAEYGADGEGADLVIDVLACSLVGQRLQIRVVDEQLAAIYGAEVADERYYCRFGLNPRYLPALEAAGLALLEAALGSSASSRVSSLRQSKAGRRRSLARRGITMKTA